MRYGALGKRGMTRREFLLTSAGAGAGLLLLGGCGGGGGSPESGEVAGWGWDIAAASLREVVPMFNEEYPDINVEVQDVGRLDLYDQVTTGLAGGGIGLPDFFMLETDRLSGYINQFPEGLANMSELGAEEYVDRIAPSKWPQAQAQDGTIFAMPWDIGPTGVFYRVDFFEEAGVNVDDIETWDDFLAAGEEILAATDVQLMSIDAANDDGLFRMMLNQQGTFYFNEAGDITLNSPEAVAAMQKIKDLWDAGLLVNAEGYDGGVTAFVNERICAAAAGVWYSGTIMDQAPDQEGLWDAFLLPAFESGGNRAANLGGSNLVINANSENVEAAWSYVEYAMGDPEAQMYMMETYGLFPSLLETYDDPFFSEPVPFFNDQPIFQIFADQVEDIPEAYYTEDYARALERSVDAMSQVLLNDGDPEQALNQAAEQLAGETGRSIA
jgi:lactose/L-arabinose transport system substrate-binding protein